MKRKITLFALIATGILAVCILSQAKDSSYDWGNTSPVNDLAWTKQVGSRLQPAGQTLSANSFGAIADSTVLSTEAIQKAIDSCAANGGGTVTLQSGYYLTGALFIKSGVNLRLDKDVTLLATPDIHCYPEFRSRIAGIEMIWPSAVINIIGQKMHPSAVKGDWTVAAKAGGTNIGRCADLMKQKACVGLWITIAKEYEAYW